MRRVREPELNGETDSVYEIVLNTMSTRGYGALAVPATVVLGASLFLVPFNFPMVPSDTLIRIKPEVDGRERAWKTTREGPTSPLMPGAFGVDRFASDAHELTHRHRADTKGG